MTSTAANKKRVQKPRIGIHMSLSGMRHVDALNATMAKFPELTDIQIFTHGPQALKMVRVDEPAFKSRLAHFGVSLWVHGSYLCVPWKSKFLSHHTLDNIGTARSLGAGCVVAHIPFSGVGEVVSGISYLVEKMRATPTTSKYPKTLCGDCKLMLETSATVADPLRSYETPEKLNRLTDALIGAGFEDCVRICIDTAHIFAGRARIRTYAEARDYCAALDTRLIGMIQLNGNSIDPDIARGDHHELPMSPPDLIWRNLSYADAGCRAFIEFAANLNIPCIVEVNPRHEDAVIRTFLNALTPIAPNPEPVAASTSAVSDSTATVAA